MADKKLVSINWIAIAAIGSAVVAAVAVLQIFDRPGPIINSPELSATIERFPYSHAQSSLIIQSEKLREELEQALKTRMEEIDEIDPKFRDFMTELIDLTILERQRSQFLLPPGYRIEDSRVWFAVTIRNNSNVPLKGVFLKFPQVQFWIDPEGRLTFVPQRIEIGEMDQKSEARYRFWGSSALSRSLYDEDDVVLGHSDGIGEVTFD